MAPVNLYVSLIGILLCVVIDAQDTTFPHPIGMWKMDNVHLEKDVTGNANHMEITSDVVASTDSPFEYYGSGSLEFTGVQNSYGTIDNAQGQLTVDKSWTYMTWHKNLGQTGFFFVFYPSASSCSHGMLFMHLQANQFHFNTMHSNVYRYTAAGTLPQDEWTHVAATYNADTGVIYTYINGAEVSSQRLSAAANLDSASKSSSSFAIVRMGSCSTDGRYMYGRMFCTQWFNEWLTEEQMNKAKELCVPARLLMGSWPWPLGAWPMNNDNKFASSHGSRNSLTLRRRRVSQGITGNRNDALRFGAVDESWARVNNDKKQVNFYGSHTIAVWIKIDNLQRPAYLLDQAANENSGTSDTTLMRNIWLTDGGVTIRNMYSSSVSVTNTNVLTIGQWMSLVIVADFSKSKQFIYINNELAAESNVDFPDSLAVDRDFLIAERFHGDEDERFHGTLYCLQIYDFPISQHNLPLIDHTLKCKRSVAHPDDGLLYRWKFSENLVDSIHNFSIRDNYDMSYGSYNHRGRKFGRSFTSTAVQNKALNSDTDFVGWDRGYGTVSFWMKIDSSSPVNGEILCIDQSGRNPRPYATYSLIIKQVPSYGGNDCNYTMNDGRASSCFLIVMHSADGGKLEKMSVLQLPWEELMGKWKHWVLTFDATNLGISALYINGIPQYVIHMIRATGLLQDEDVLKINGLSRQAHIECLQFYSTYKLAHDISRMRDACHGDNRKDYMMPVGFWPLDGTHGDSDISEQVIGWNVTSVDTTLTTGVLGYPDTAYAFNGQSSYIEIPNRDGRAEFLPDYAVSFWVYFDEANTTEDQVFATYSKGSDETAVVMRIRENAYYFDIWTHEQELLSWKAGKNIESNRWYEVMLTSEGYLGRVASYQDSSRKGFKVMDPYTQFNGGIHNYTWKLGQGYHDSTLTHFKGKIACFQLYDYYPVNAQKKFIHKMCKVKDPADTRFKKADGLSDGYAPKDHLVERTTTTRNTLNCMAECVKDNSCKAAVYQKDNSGTCKMSSQRVEDSSDLDSDYEHAGAADYFELHEPFKDTV